MTQNNLITRHLRILSNKVSRAHATVSNAKREGEKMENKMEDLVLELIIFLKKWGLWTDTGIFALGNRYGYCSEKEKTFREQDHVEFTENMNPEDYTSGMTEERDCNGNPVWKSFSNPEHILDMIFEGPLYLLLWDETYEVRKADLSPEAWDYIFDHTDFFDEYLYELYDLASVEELYEKVMEDKFDNPDHSAWDPLVFDTWEEYQEFTYGVTYRDEEEEGYIPNYQRYGTYEEYVEDMELAEVLKPEDLQPVWEKMVYDAKCKFRKGEKENETLSLSGNDFRELSGFLRKEFDGIFERYGLWYDFGFRWNLTCYRRESHENLCDV